MLQSIREHTQGWIAGTIISIIILTFALWGIHSYFIGGGSNVNVAEVNGVDISRDQLSAAYQRLRRQIQSQPGINQSLAKDDVALKNRALQGLIGIEVLKQAADAQGFRVFDRQVDNYLLAVPEFQVKGQFSQERFQTILANLSLSTSEFLDLVGASLLIDQPKMGVLFTSFALPNETETTIALVNQERDIDYILIPSDYFLSQPKVISSDRINAYYQAHKDAFMAPEQMSVDYITLSLNDIANKINPTDAELKRFYDDNASAYTSQMQWKLFSINIPIAPGASEEEIKKAELQATEATTQLNKTSDFTKLTYPKGDLNGQTWVELSQLPSELQQPVAELKAGAVSQPIQTAKGLTVIKVIAIKEPERLSFDQAKSQVRQVYVRQHAEEKFAEQRDQLADLTYEHPDSLETAAKTLNLPIQTSELFTRTQGGRDVSYSQKLRNVAFSNEVVNLQNNSDVILVDSSTAVVIHLKTHYPAKLLSLDVVSKQIEDKLKKEMSEAQAQKLAEDLKGKFQTGTDAQQVMSANKLAWTKVGFTGRYASKIDSAILDTAFSMPYQSSDKLNYAVARLSNGYAVIALKGMKNGAVDSKEYAVFAEQVQNSQGALEYELYKLSQMDSAKIHIQQ